MVGGMPKGRMATVGMDELDTENRGMSRCARWAWLPIPILLALMIALRAANLQGTHESIHLLLIVNLIFSMFVPLFVAYLIARSFLVRGTPVRNFVLGSGAGLFALTAVLLGHTGRRVSSFAHWYGLALLLTAVGLIGVMLQPYHASLLGWLGRMTQSLGGVYMLIAAVASVRESHAWGIPLEAALRESEHRYRMLLDLAPDAIVVHREGRFLYANAAALSLDRRRQSRRAGPAHDLDFFRAQDREVHPSGSAWSGGRQIADTRGDDAAPGRLRRVVEFHTAPLDFEGAPAILTIIRDITARRQARRAAPQRREHPATGGGTGCPDGYDAGGGVGVRRPAVPCDLRQPRGAAFLRGD